MRTVLRFLSLVSASLILAAVSQASPAPGPAPFVRLDRVTASKPLPTGIEIRSGSAILRITALRDDVIRVRVGPQGQLPEDASWAVLDSARTASVPVSPLASPDSVGFRTAKLIVAVNKSSLALTVTDLAGHVIAQTLSDRPIEYHGDAFRLYFHSSLDEHYFGLGDKPGPLDRRNEAFSNWNTDNYGWQESTDPLYKSIPFFITFNKGASAGIYLDNTWHTSFDFNKEYRDGYSFGAEGGPLDLYILYGPQPKSVVEDWAWLTGPTPLPPMWALGFQQSRWSYYPESEVRRIASTLRSDHIPADVIWMDIDYQLKNRPFTVDPERFPHFAQMIQDLKAQEFHTVLITDLHIADAPGIGYKPYDEGAAGRHFVTNPDGSTYVGTVWPGNAVFPDYTRKASREWWGTLYTDFVAQGVAGFWNDMNEPSIFDVQSDTMPDNTVHRIEEPGFAPRKASHLEVHNIFGMQNSRATFEGVLKLDPNRRPFVLTRASFAGGQRYAATWTGDNSATWNHLRQTTPQLLNLGLSGFALSGADVGGFAGSPQPEVLTRWLQLGAFQPIDRDHSAKGTQPHEPWENGTQQDVDLRRKAIEERYRLMPYIYTTAEEMSRTGLPIIRPLFLEFPNNNLADQPLDLTDTDAFLLGADLLVAQTPFPDKLDEETIVLPSVGWYDYWTGALVGKEVKNDTLGEETPLHAEVGISRNIDTLPVFVRPGAIVPRQPLIQSTMEKPQGPLNLRIYPPTHPEDECKGSLYLDDGVSYAFQKGEYLRVEFTCKLTANGLTVSVAPRQGSFASWWNLLSIEVYGAAKPPAEVTVSDAAASTTPVVPSYDSEAHRITAVVPDDGKGLELQLAY